jgi:hypothetical protein
MKSLSGLVERISGRHQQISPHGLEPKFIEHLHERLVTALTRGDRDALTQLLAADSEWRGSGRVIVGRSAVIDALLAGDYVQAQVGAVQARVHGEFAVVEALWKSRAGGNSCVWTRSCIFALRRGYWQLISLRDLTFDRSNSLRHADGRCLVGSDE